MLGLSLELEGRGQERVYLCDGWEFNICVIFESIRERVRFQSNHRAARSTIATHINV